MRDTNLISSLSAMHSCLDVSHFMVYLEQQDLKQTVIWMHVCTICFVIVVFV